MITPKIPDNEQERLEALHSLNILDTLPEERFDRITRLTKQLFKVPVALVSLIANNRQWFKSHQGIDVTETPRDVSFCGHAILESDMLLVEDATLDNRFWDNPLVLEDPHIKFYAGCPLTVKKDYPVGTLCMIDNDARVLSSIEQETMRKLADMAQFELEHVESSTIDPLTGITDKVGFLNLGGYAFKLCKQDSKDLTLLLFDLDQFKFINDTFGQNTGDEILKTFAQSLLKNFRNSDVIARLEGDRFSVLCSDLSEKNILKLLQRFQIALKKEVQKSFPIEYCVGYVIYDDLKHQNLEDILQEAEQNMAEQKCTNKRMMHNQRPKGFNLSD